MLVLGVAFLVMLPAGYLFYSFTQSNQDTIEGSQITRSGREIVTKAEEMYTIGPNSWTTLEVNLPESVENVYVNGRELVIRHQTQVGVSDAVFFSRINLTSPYGGNISGNFTPGYTSVRVESNGTEVLVYEAS
jgi:hypothetical protein